jgi:hypothetical protein
VEQVAGPAHRVVTLRIAYDSEGVDWEQVEPYAGVTYLVLPTKAPSAELWAQHVQARFLHPNERRSHGPLQDADPIAGC